MLEQDKGSTDLPMNFCSEVQDDPDVEFDPSVVQETENVASPQTYKSTSLNVQAPALGTVPEEEEAHLDDDVALAFLGMLEDKDMECMFGDTPEALKLARRNGQVQGTVEEVTMALWSASRQAVGSKSTFHLSTPNRRKCATPLWKLII